MISTRHNNQKIIYSKRLTAGVILALLSKYCTNDYCYVMKGGNSSQHIGYSATNNIYNLKGGKKVKKSIIALVVMAIFCISSVVLAAANPFDDVPAKHWAYDAVNKLAKDGVIDGNGNRTFGGDKPMTRYEMALVVGKAISNATKADAENKALIEKLSNEFQKELENLGVRVKALEKKSDKLTVSGFLHLSEQVWRNSGVYEGSYFAAGKNPGYGSESPHADDGQWLALGVDLFTRYKVNNNWQLVIHDDLTRDAQSGSFAVNSSASDGLLAGQQRGCEIYAIGSTGITNVKVGKFDYIPVYGMFLWPDNKAVVGAQFSVGDPKELKATATYGYLRKSWTGTTVNPRILSGTTDNRYAALELTAAIAKDANIKAAYHRVSNDGNYTNSISGATDVVKPYATTMNFWELGADKMLTPKLKLYGEIERSDANTENKAFIVGLTYGKADIKTPGSFSITGRYVHWDINSSVNHGTWMAGQAHGAKGPELASNFIIDENVGIMTWVNYMSPTDGTSGKIRTIKTELDFYF
ncbi:MAG: S-layer y domain protein [Sporomusa sp.]|jgi:hypothetical protein|nr:S-layer y domain protein [Sporomusa sp.]